MLTVKNFKKYRHIALPLDKEEFLISGKSGSGKTQALWAYLLFFRAYNGQSTVGDYQTIHLKPEILNLLDQRFLGLQEYSSFLNASCGGKGTAHFEASFSDDHKFEVLLYANGNISLSKGISNGYNGSKIYFSYMRPSFQFNAQIILPSEFITCNDSALRHRYANLEEETSQATILCIMKKLFNIEKLDNHTSSNFYDIFFKIKEDCVTDNDNDGDGDGDDYSTNNQTKLLGMDIMFFPLSHQKVLASLILLFTLIEIPVNDGDLKYYLMDDIESDLEPEVIKNLYGHLRDICRSNNIRLIVTTRLHSAMINSEDDK